MAATAGRGILKGAAIISFFVLIGKVVGFVQKQVMAHYFGTGAEADAFTLVFSSLIVTIGLFPQQLLAPFLPLFIDKKEKEGEAPAWRLAASVGTLLILILVVVVPLGMVLAPQLVDWVSSFKDDSTTRIATGLARTMMPAVLFMGFTALLALLLNSYRNFVFTPLGDTFNKIVMIGCLVLFYRFWGINGLALGVVAGTLAALMTQAYGLRGRLPAKLNFGIDWKDPALKRLLILMLPLLFSAFVAQLRVIIDYKFATGMAEGSSAGLGFARTLTDTLITLVPAAVGVAIFPAFADMAAAEDRSEMTETLMRSFRLLAFVFIPVTVALVLLRVPLVQLAFQRGRFTNESVALTAAPLAWYSAGLTILALEIILMRFYVAMKNTMTPAVVGALCVLVHWGVILLSREALQNSSMALAATVSKTVKVGVLFVLLGQILPSLQGRRNGLFVLKSAVAALAMAGVILLALWVEPRLPVSLPEAGMARILFLAVKLGVVGGAGFLVFLGLAHAFRMEETAAILDFVKRRRKAP